MRKKLVLSYEAITNRFFINLPTYTMIPGTFGPVTTSLIFADGIHSGANVAAVLALNPYVECDFPDEYVTPSGDLSASRIAAMYEIRDDENMFIKEHPKFHKSFVPPIEIK